MSSSDKDRQLKKRDVSRLFIHTCPLLIYFVNCFLHFFWVIAQKPDICLSNLSKIETPRWRQRWTGCFFSKPTFSQTVLGEKIFSVMNKMFCSGETIPASSLCHIGTVCCRFKADFTPSFPNLLLYVFTQNKSHKKGTKVVNFW